MPRIYLAGPIAGKTWEQATSWRDKVEEILLHTLTTKRIECFSPLRGKTMAAFYADLSIESKRMAEGLPTILSQSSAIMTRDYQDCVKADCILVNLLHDTGSLGTAMELAWAWANHIPVVAIVAESRPPHPMIDTAISHRITAGDEDSALLLACKVVRSILLP